MYRRVAALLLSAALPCAQAATYICVIDGKPVYTTVRQNKQCRLSQMDGLAEQEGGRFAAAETVSPAWALPDAASEPPRREDKGEDAIGRIWREHEYGSYDRTPILPPPPIVATPVPPPAPAVKPRRLPPIAVVPVRIAASPKVLTRREVLEREIRREQTALAAANNRLQAARKRGDAETVKRLQAHILDREHNIRALHEEWRR